MKIGNVFVYCLYACIQMYILMSTGYLAYKKKLFNSKSISIVSELLFNFLIPAYSMIEIARIGTIEILNIFWILVVNFVCALILSYLLAVSFHYAFNLDKRIKESYNLVCAIPAMGALPLVIGKAFCFPGGPIEGDIFCQNIIGLMMLCYLILCIAVFLIGYLLIISDKKKNTVIIEKMIYLWPSLVDRLFSKDYAVMYLFDKFISNKKQSKRLFEEFDKEHHDDLFCLSRAITPRKQLETQPIEGINQNDVIINTQKTTNGNKQIDNNQTDTNKKKETYKDTFNDSYFEYCSHDTKTIKANSPYRESSRAKPNQQLNNNLASQFCILFTRKDSFYPGNDIKPKFNTGAKTKTDYFKNNKSNIHIKKKNIIKIEFDQENIVLRKAKSELNGQLPICSKNNAGLITNLSHDNNEAIDYPSMTIKKTSPNIVFVDESPISDHNDQKIKTNKEILIRYYQSVFDIINNYQNENNIDRNNNKALINDYEEIKKEILTKVSYDPPKYPIVRSVLIDQKALDIIEEEWPKFEPQLKALSLSFTGFPKVSIDMNNFIKKVFCPPTVSIMLGLILSLSGIRTLIFNKENFFFTNIVDGLDTLDKVMVPFLFCLIGLSAASTDGLSANTPLKKQHIILVFIARFIIIPLVGLGFIYLWKEYYGGIVKQSLAFRIIMYFPWCLPSAPNLAVVINLTQYFFEEYGYLILLQNASCVITLTILYMIYFITVGL